MLTPLHTIITFYALACLSTLEPSTSAFTIPFFTVRFLAIAALSGTLLFNQKSNVLCSHFLGVFSLWWSVPLMLLVIMAPNTDAILSTWNSLGKAFTIHFKASCLLTVASLFLWFGFFNLTMRNFFNLSQLVSLFVLWTLREKINIFAIVQNKV